MDARTQILKKKDRRTSVCCENNIPTRPHLKYDV